MKNVRLYGNKPYTVAVVHGGPGAPGEMAPVARELERDYGVMEPLQTKDSISGQVEELAGVLKEHGTLPVVLVGHSWGAVLSCLTAVHFPTLVKKLILIGMPSLEKPLDLSPLWLSRLSEEERIEYLSLENLVWDGAVEDKSEPMGRLFRLIAKAESYDPLPVKDEVLQYQLDINIAVGLEMRKFLGGGGLLKASRQVTCPVVAIHGDYDPRIAEGVREPLVRVLKDFRFILLEKCGHEPWVEKFARDEFYDILKNELE